MWSLWTKAKTYHKLPSEVLGEEDNLAAWMLDSAVTWFGITIENALQERDKVKMGTETQYRPRYTLSRLLQQGFKLPRPLPEPEIKQGGLSVWQPLLAWAGKPGGKIKRWVYVPPTEDSPKDDEVNDGRS